MKVETKQLAPGIWVLYTPGLNRVVKKSKGHLSIWDGGWKHLCAPHTPWEKVADILVALNKETK